MKISLPWMRLPTLMRGVIVAFVILTVGQLPPGLFLALGLRFTPAVPWFLVGTAIWLAMFWMYVDGRGFSVPETGQLVRHAQLRLGTNLIMLGSSRDDGLKSPQTLGAGTQALYVYVPDVDEHCERARLAGAEITTPPQDTDFGLREYHVRDSEGHLWTFGTYLPNGDAA